MNVELHGLLSEYQVSKAEEVTDRLNSRPSLKNEDFTVTIVDSRSHRKDGKNRPFVRVFSDDKDDFAIVREVMNGIKIPGTSAIAIECVLLHAVEYA